MKRISPLALLLVVLVSCVDSPVDPTLGADGVPYPTLGGTDGSAGVVDTVFGPEVFVRPPFQPWNDFDLGDIYWGEIREFVVELEHYEGPFTVHIRNGDEQGKHKATSAWVLLNGKVVFQPRDFRWWKAHLSSDVELTENSKLRVRVAGLPGTQFTLWVEGRFKPGTARIGPEGGIVTSEDKSARLTIPEGALTDRVILSLAQVETSLPIVTALVTRVTGVYELRPHGIAFAIPARLTVTVPPSALGEVENPEQIQIFEVRPDLEAVVRTGSYADSYAGTVSTELRHFSYHTVLVPIMGLKPGLYPALVLNAPDKLDAGGDVGSAVSRALASWQTEVGKVNRTFRVFNQTSPGDGAYASPIRIEWVPFTAADLGLYGKGGFDWWLLEIRVFLNSEWQWYAGSTPRSGTVELQSYSVESAILHEFGHVLGLVHTNNRECQNGPQYPASCFAPPIMVPFPEATWWNYWRGGKRDLTALYPSDVERIRGLYHIANPSTNPEADYALDGSTTDASGNGHHAELWGAPFVYIADRLGNPAAALHFDAVDDSLNIPEGVVNGLATGTISFWLKLDDINRQYYVFSTKNWPDYGEYGMAFQFGGGTPEAGPVDKFYFQLNAEVCTFPSSCWVTPPAGTDFTQWHMYTFTWEYGLKRIYLDGALLAQDLPGPSASPSDGKLVFGSAHFVRNEMLKGSLDDVRIYTRQLSDAEVAGLYASSGSAP